MLVSTMAAMLHRRIPNGVCMPIADRAVGVLYIVYQGARPKVALVGAPRRHASRALITTVIIV